MSVIELKDHEEYTAAIKTGNVIVDFYAVWCGPCKMIAPKYAGLANEYSNFKFYKIDVGEHDSVSDDENIVSMPTFKLFVNGVEKSMIIGTNIDKIVAALESNGAIKGAPLPAEIPVDAPATATTPEETAATPTTTTPSTSSVTTITTDRDFDNLVKHTSNVAVVDFFATWCGPCKTVAPNFENLSKTYASKGVRFFKVDIEELEEIATDYNVSNLPTFVVFKNGKPASTIVGANLTKVESAIDALLGKSNDDTQIDVVGNAAGSGELTVNVVRTEEAPKLVVHDDSWTPKPKVTIPPVPHALDSIMQDIKQTTNSLIFFPSSRSINPSLTLDELREAVTSHNITVVPVDWQSDSELATEFNISENDGVVVKSTVKGVVYKTYRLVNNSMIKTIIDDLISLKM